MLDKIACDGVSDTSNTDKYNYFFSIEDALFLVIVYSEKPHTRCFVILRRTPFCCLKKFTCLV